MSQIDVFTTADMRQIFTIQDGPSGNRTHKTAVQVQKFPVSLPAQTHRRLSLRGSRFYSLLTAKNDISYLYCLPSFRMSEATVKACDISG